MEQKLLSDLQVGDKFKLHLDGVVWTVIDINPSQYRTSIRAKGEKITAPFYKHLLCYPIL